MGGGIRKKEKGYNLFILSFFRANVSILNVMQILCLKISKNIAGSLRQMAGLPEAAGSFPLLSSLLLLLGINSLQSVNIYSKILYFLY